VCEPFKISVCFSREAIQVLSENPDVAVVLPINLEMLQELMGNPSPN